MKQSAKTFGYGFSALVLALSGVVISPNTSSATTCTITDGATAQAQVGATITMCQDLSTTLAISSNTTIDLAGYTFTGNISVAAGATLTVKDTAKSGTMNTTITTTGTGAVTFDTTLTDKTTFNANDGAIIKSLPDATGVITINGGTFTGDAIVASTTTGALSSAGRLKIKGGDFTGVSAISSSAVANFAVITGGIFAVDPTDSVDTTNGTGEDTTDDLGVFTDGSKYVVTAKSTVANTAATAALVDEELEGAFTLSFAESKVGGIANSLTFTVTDQTDGSATKGEEVAFSDIYSYRTSTDNKSTVSDKTDDVVTYHLTAKKAGKYDVKATSNDGQSQTITLTNYEYNSENAIKDIYMVSPTADGGAVIDLTASIKKYVGDNAVAAAVTLVDGDTEDTDAGNGLTVSGQKVTIIKNAAAGSYEYKTVINGVTTSHYVHVIAATEATKDITLMAEDTVNGGYTASEATVPTYWNIKSVSGSAVSATRKTDSNGDAVNKVTITPQSVGTSVITYTLDTDAWVYTDALKTSSSEVATAAAGFTKTATYYTYEVHDGYALETGATVAGDAESYGAIIDVDSSAVTVTAVNNTAEANRVTTFDNDAKTVAPKENKNGTDSYTFTLAATGATNKTATVNVHTYVADELDDAEIYMDVDDGTNASVAMQSADKNDAYYVANPNAKFASDSESVTISGDGKTVTYKASKVGSETVTLNVMLGETVIDSFDVTYNVYGLDLQSDYYVQPGETFELAVADPYGSVAVSSAIDKTTPATPVALKDYDFSDGVFSLTSSTEGIYEITFRDVITADTGGVIAPVIKPIKIHVAETYITADEDTFALDITDGAVDSDQFTIDATAGTISASVESAYDEDGVYDSDTKISLKTISKKAGTYKLSAAANTLPGDYTVTLNLKDSSNNVIAEQVLNVKVVKYAALPDGIYTLNSKLADNMVLDINAASVADGANAQLYKSNDTLAQQFLFTADEDGAFTITNLRSGKALDVAGGVAANGTNVQQYESNDTASQKWTVRYADGVVVDADDAKNSFTLVSSLGEELVLDVAGGIKKNGANVQIYENNGTVSQQWGIAPVAASDVIAVNKDKSYTIHSALDTNMVLDISGGSTESGANLQLYTANDTDAQSFKFVEEGGLYTIINVNSGKAIDVAGAGRSNGTNVQQYEANGTVAQKWIIEDNGDGTFSFKSAHSDLYLDVAGGHTKDNTNIHVYKGNKTKAQKFRIVEVAE